MGPLGRQFKTLQKGLIALCTGRADETAANEEHYRENIMVLASAFWLVIIGLVGVVLPFTMKVTPEGLMGAQLVLGSTCVGIILSLLTLRLFGNRMLSLNILLTVYAMAFAGSCFFFGGTNSPTYPMLIMLPCMAGLLGSVSLSAFWALLTLGFWVATLMVERSGFQFIQIIKPHDLSVSMVMAYSGLAGAIVSILVIYAEMNRKLREDLLEKNEALQHLSTHDQLTRLPNRRFYDERIGTALKRAADHNTMTALLFLDLNEFKEINDTHGHGAGDKLLIATGQRISQNLRETDLVARLGGDEFAAVLEDVSSIEEVTRIAHKLAQAIEQPLSVRHHQLNFSASIGVAIYPLDGRQQIELEEKADKAMYLAKKRGISVALHSLEAGNALTPVKVRRELA